MPQGAVEGASRREAAKADARAAVGPLRFGPRVRHVRLAAIVRHRAGGRQSRRRGLCLCRGPGRPVRRARRCGRRSDAGVMSLVLGAMLMPVPCAAHGRGHRTRETLSQAAPGLLARRPLQPPLVEAILAVEWQTRGGGGVLVGGRGVRRRGGGGRDGSRRHRVVGRAQLAPRVRALLQQPEVFLDAEVHGVAYGEIEDVVGRVLAAVGSHEVPLQEGLVECAEALYRAPRLAAGHLRRQAAGQEGRPAGLPDPQLAVVPPGQLRHLLPRAGGACGHTA
mmetsp:Transcript_77012/g.198317  ORF Transcript_77012/g.198317 Transcript_77012/m.198317 type:complete len:279 (+) Transcript_77012:831-1667(+)